MAPPELLVIGDCNPDLVLGPDATPVFGQTETLVEEAKLTVGGSASIVACGAARLGVRTTLASLVGDDVFGRAQLAALATRSVDTSAVKVGTATPTGVTVILRRGEDRAILTSTGAIAELRTSQVEAAVRAGPRHLHVTPYFLLDSMKAGLPALLDIAREAGATTSLDTNWDPSGGWAALDSVLDRVDVFLPNEAEARRLTGRETAREAALELSRTVGTVVVKRGAEGALARSGDAESSARPPTVRVVDAVGAGDSFAAGFLASRLRGWTLERSLRLACSCGALSTRMVGGVAAQPTMDEALAAAGLGPA
jgi:sugar/nucleoside kinase (ribokinase family)